MGRAQKHWNGVAHEKGLTVNESNGRRPQISLRMSVKRADENLARQRWGKKKWDVAARGDLSEAGMELTRESIALANAEVRAVRLLMSTGNFNPHDHFSMGDEPGVAAVCDDVTMNDLFDAFLESAPKKKRAATTILKYRQNFYAWLSPAFGHLRPNQLTREMIEDWLASVRDMTVTAVLKPRKTTGRVVSKKPYQPKEGTVKLILAALSGTIKMREHRKYFPVNPAADIGLHDIWGGKRLDDKSDYNVRPFTLEEIAAISAVCTPEQRRFFVFWIHTGLRIAELCALKADKVVLKDETILVQRQFTLGELREGPLLMKTRKSYRAVPLVPEALDALKEQMAENMRHPRDHTFIWSHWKTGAPMTKTSADLDSPWRTLLAKAGVDYRNPEQCRHTCASMMLAAGVPIETVTEILGHDTTVTTRKYYARHIPVSKEKHKFNMGESRFATKRARPQTGVNDEQGNSHDSAAI